MTDFAPSLRKVMVILAWGIVMGGWEGLKYNWGLGQFEGRKTCRAANAWDLLISVQEMTQQVAFGSKLICFLLKYPICA